MTEELKKLELSAEQKQQGQFVLDNQQTGQEFCHVSQKWLDRCKPISAAIESITRQVTQDYSIVLGELFFIQDSKGVQFLTQGHVLKLDEYAIGQFCNLVELPRAVFKHYNSEILARQTILLDCLSQARKENPERKLVLRTQSGTIYGVVTPSYSPIANVDFLEILGDIIPDGLVSHDTSTPFGLFCNILIPDTLRNESDSDYGGMVRVTNSEIGRSSLSVLPSIFRAICMNGNVWGSQDGMKYSRKHVGISLFELKKELAQCVHDQIPLVDYHIRSLLDSHKLKLETTIDKVIVQSVLDNGWNSDFCIDISSEWLKYSNEKTCFGVIDGITRAAQNQSNEVWSSAENFAGSILSPKNWESLNRRASILTNDDIHRVFAAV